MIEDDRILSVGNVYSVVSDEYPYLNMTPPENRDKLANLDYIADLTGVYVDGSLKHKPICARNLVDSLSIIAELVKTDYILLEYISSNGYAWIDTGYTPNYQSKVVFHCEILKNTSQTGDPWYPIFGARKSSSDYTTCFGIFANSDNELRVDYQQHKLDIEKTKNVGRNCYILDGLNHRVTISGLETTFDSVAEYDVPVTLTLFAYNQTNGVDRRNSIGKIYECSIYDNGTLVKWLFPAKQKSTGKLGMYDIVNEEFIEESGSASTKFTAGPDICDMPKFSINGYSLLEYAYSNANAYFDIGFIPKHDTRFLIEFEKRTSNYTTDQYAFSARNSKANGYGLVSKSNGPRWRDDYGTEKTSATGVVLKQRMLLDKNKNITYFPTFTVTHAETTFTDIPDTLGLFFSHENGGKRGYPIDMDFYWGCLFDNGKPIRLYFPYKRQSDGVVGLYDFINRTFSLPMVGSLKAGSQITK